MREIRLVVVCLPSSEITMERKGEDYEIIMERKRPKKNCLTKFSLRVIEGVVVFPGKCCIIRGTYMLVVK